MNVSSLKKYKILVTGGAGFIGSNLCEFLLNCGSKVVCFDNFSTGKKNNISTFLNHKNFKLIEGDIRNLEYCQKATKNIDFVLHQAALGSVPRSIKDPITTNEVNITGFLNMLVASRENKVKRFIYAASSSTYGDSKNLPKIENEIGNPLSPYAITKYVNELYAQNFFKLYNLQTIGLRYFNVFGRRQDPDSVYAAVIPKFVKQMINYQSPTINGDGNYSRDFTYIDNVIQMNVLSILTNDNKSLNEVYNTACGDRNSLIDLFGYLKKHLGKIDTKILNVEPVFGPYRQGDIPHSLASIEKAKKLLGYNPEYNLEMGIKEAIKWYYKNL